MLRKKQKQVVVAAVAGIGGMFVSPMAQAAPVSWTTTSPTGDSGNWSDPTKWTGANVPDTTGEDPVFGGYANDRTITVDASTYTIGKLTIVPRTTGFSAKNFTLNSSGGGALAITAGLDIDNGGTASINVPITITGIQTWNALSQPAGNASFNQIIGGTGQINRSSTGGSSSVFTFSGANTFSGGYSQSATNAPTTRLGITSAAGATITNGPLGTGTVTLSGGGGNLSSNNTGARTLYNNIVIGGTMTLGNSTNNGALTFTDSGLTTATTFALSSATQGNVTTLRIAGTNVNIDQAITELGGAGQSVNFASTSGTPTISIGRTKSATGNILAGGVGLVLGNSAAASGSIIGVNGSVTATGSNKFSSGALLLDATNLISTDASNFSAIAGGKATVFNNSRVSFATDQTQSTVAGLLTSNSHVRLGLSSGSLSPTVTQSYDQSAIGNGLAGLVSASTGTVTYTGTLTAGTDNTFRVGGGLGTLALTGATLTGSGKNVSIEGGGTVNASAAQTHTGSTSINSSLTLSGANGALSSTNGITINNTALTLDNATANGNRLANGAAISLNRGTLAMNNSTTAIAETIGTVTVNSGYNIISMGTSAGASNTKSLNTGAVSRTAGSVVLFRGDSFGLASGGGSALTRNLFTVTNAPSGTDYVGGSGANGSTSLKIIPWARTGAGTTATGGNFLTFDTSNNSLRPLTAAEMNTGADTTWGITDNVKQTNAATGTTTLLTNTRTVNSFILANAGSTGSTTGSLGGFTLNVTSGAVDLSHTVAQNFTLNNGTLAFGSAEGVITNSGGSQSLTSVNANITGGGGLTVFANNNNGLLGLGGTNTFTNGTTVGSVGTAAVAVSNDTNFGDSTNSITHAGGELRFFAGFSTARNLSLLANVGNNTLGNNTTSNTVTLTGNISGGGLLRLVNNASTVGIGGFSLGGSNTYSGGTQIEGISVTGSSNNALGTGTVTLIGANSNVASLSLTGTAPVLGGLRGTDGTVTINPSGSAATLTVGSNNDNTVFNGVIAQGSGKTGSLSKTGTGTLVLGGNQTYTGTTSVTGGTLSVNGSLSTGAVSVSSAGTLGGSGYIGGAVSVGSGGTLAPGNSIGTLTVNNTLSLGGTSLFEISKNGGTFTNDEVVGITGTSPALSYGGVLKILNAGPDATSSFAAGNSWDLLDFTSQTGTFSNNNVFGTAGDGTNLPTLNSGLKWAFNYASGELSVENANFVSLTTLGTSNTTPATITVTGANDSYIAGYADLVSDPATGTIQVNGFDTFTPGTVFVLLDLEGSVSNINALLSSLGGAVVASNGGNPLSVLPGWSNNGSSPLGDYEALLAFTKPATASPYYFNFDFAGSSVTLDRIAIVPEPASGAALAIGAVGLLARRKRRDGTASR